MPGKTLISHVSEEDTFQNYKDFTHSKNMLYIEIDNREGVKWSLVFGFKLSFCVIKIYLKVSGPVTFRLSFSHR